MEDKRIQEQKFNKAKKEFEKAVYEIKKACDTWENMFFLDGNVDGLTKEGYDRIRAFLESLNSDIYEREVITINTSTNKQETKTELTIPEKNKSFWEVIKIVFFRFIGIKENNKSVIEEKQSGIQDYDEEEKFLNSESDEKEYSKSKKFNVDELIQNCQKAYEILVEQGEELDKIYEKHLNDEPEGNVIETLHDGPGILNDYRQESWGVERICLDGFQNHLPKDAKGTKCYLQFLINSGWVDRDTALENRNQITKVRFCDNGVGFTPDNLFFLHSTKTSEDISVGQFGEGMKLASIAAVNLGLGLEFQSRNWKARASGEEKKITNTRKNDEVETRKQLVYDVEVYDGEPIVGSRTIFHTPTKEFLDYALKLPELIITLGDKEVVAETPKGSIVDMDGGKAFVKGVFLKNIASLFSYDFKDGKVNPDRNDFYKYNVKDAIAQILVDVEDKKTIMRFFEKLLKYSAENMEEIEKHPYTYNYPEDIKSAKELIQCLMDGRLNAEKIELWRDAFIEACNSLYNKDNPKEVVLKTNYKIPKQMEDLLDNYIIVKLPGNWKNFLINIGVKTDESIIPEYTEEIVPTSISLDYGSQIWDTQRIVLDGCQNHLPSDSQGTQIFLRFQTIDGNWHDYREFDKFADEEISRIKISDDGIGYDYKNLGLFASVKDKSSSGKWGERTKNVICCCN